MKKVVFFGTLALILLPGPAIAAKKVALTPMELQAIQSKEFEASKESLFASCMSVFQDLGYTIDSADVQTGFITAQSPTVNKTNFGEALFGMASSGNTKSTAFIEQMPNGRSRVRLNFVISKNMSTQYGQNSKSDKPILDPKPYTVAWDKIDEALFVRGALAKPAPANNNPAPTTSPNPVTPTTQTAPTVTETPSAPRQN
jgi:hypothetical protein